MVKFKTGDIVKSNGNSNCTYKVLEAGDEFCRIELHTSFGDEVVGLGRNLGPRGEGVSNRTLSLVSEQPATPFTLLDDEGRKALKAGDRALMEVTILNPELDEEGDICVLQDFTQNGPHQNYVKPKDLFALLPPAKRPAAVGAFVSILGRTGSKGKVLAFASNGHAVVEYAAGDGINVAHYDLSCLEVIS